MNATGKVKRVEIRAVKIRADGKREDLGVISQWHRNPLRRFWWWLKRRI